jgi:6-phosphogluconate dehydrogenase
MYHNAGEYAILEIWGEVCAIMKAWGMAPEKIAETLTAWKTKTGGAHPNLLSSYMLDITVEVMKMKDSTSAGGEDNGELLLNKTMDKIGSKGTGLWSVQEALGVGCPAPSLAEAVLARQMSMCRDERLANNRLISFPAPAASNPTDEDVEDLYWAATLSIIASYAQMFQCLRVLDKEFQFGLNLPATIATFRAGCILQGYLLQPMTKAFEENPNLSSLLVAFSSEITTNMPRFKRLVGKVCAEVNVCVPVLLTSLSYIQTMTQENIVSAQVTALQRDVFGRHGFKRLDKEGDFNAMWPELQ